MEKQMLEGKVAVITGASYGMGQTMAELFAEEGAAVVLTARGREKEALKIFLPKNEGVIINVSSVNGTRPSGVYLPVSRQQNGASRPGAGIAGLQRRVSVRK